MFISSARRPLQVAAPLTSLATPPTPLTSRPTGVAADAMLWSSEGRDLDSPDWTPQHQARLDALSTRLSDVLGRRGSRGVAEQLNDMRDDGVLLDGDSENLTTLDRLTSLTSQPLGEGIDRRRLLTSLIDHLHDPETISQGEQGSCAPATVQHQLASTQPGEYARLVQGLASPEGRVVTQKGELLEREAESSRRFGRRDLTSSLLQDSFTEFANGPENYDAGRDQSTGLHNPALHEANPHIENSGHIEGGHPGLYPQEVRRLAEAVLPGRFENRYVEQGVPGQALAEMEHSLGENGTVLAGLQWATGGHRLLVTGMDEQTVTLWNPWGQDDGSTRGGAPRREVLTETGSISMSRNDFAERLQTYVVSQQ